MNHPLTRRHLLTGAASLPASPAQKQSQGSIVKSSGAKVE